MPCIHVNIAAGGPLLIATVAISVPRMHALHAANVAIPPSVSGTFLIDTGASSSCIDPALLAGFGLQATGRVGISTPSTAGQPHYCDQYDVSIFLPSHDPSVGHLIPALPVIATHLRSQGIEGLIGRDVLKDCMLVYNGSASTFTIAY